MSRSRSLHRRPLVLCAPSRLTDPPPHRRPRRQPGSRRSFDPSRRLVPTAPSSPPMPDTGALAPGDHVDVDPRVRRMAKNLLDDLAAGDLLPPAAPRRPEDDLGDLVLAWRTRRSPQPGRRLSARPTGPRDRRQSCVKPRPPRWLASYTAASPVTWTTWSSVLRRAASRAARLGK